MALLAPHVQTSTDPDVIAELPPAERSTKGEGPLEILMMRLDDLSEALERLSATPTHPERGDDPESGFLLSPEDAAALRLLIHREHTGLIEETHQALLDQLELFVETGLREAVSGRRNLLQRWSWSLNGEAGRALYDLRGVPDLSLPGLGPLWPGEAAPLEVARWAQKKLNKLAPKLGDKVLDQARRDLWPPPLPALSGAKRPPKADGAREIDTFAWLQWPNAEGETVTVAAGNLALLYLAERDVREGLRRPVLAVDAGREHHHLIVGWRDLPKLHFNHPSYEQRSLPQEGGRIELFINNGRSVQLTLPIEEFTPHDALIHSLRQLQGHEGLRHWAALLRLFSVEGGRRGFVRWTMSQHLDALGYSSRIRENPERRAEIARSVEMLTRIELATYSHDGALRSRAPVLSVGMRHERFEGSEYRLDGMELQINPLLYEGVRDSQSGRLGNRWFPAPVELARINHVKHPHAIILGLLLPIRWRWDLWDGKAYTVLKGQSLLALAGIKHQPRNPKLGWQRLERDLDELQRIGLLGHYEWEAQPWQMDSACRLYPSDWLVDRTTRGLLPSEPMTLELPQTGAELITWRAQKQLSQETAAKQLGVARRTIIRAESEPTKNLTPALRRALSRPM